MSDGRVERQRVIQLTRRDIDDANRLLTLLAGSEGKVMIGPALIDHTQQSTGDPVSKQRALDLLSYRRKRHNIFGKAMFGEPAWEMLLLLYAIGPRETVSRLAELAYASKSTAIRWIDYLEGQALVRRGSHPTDKRATLVELTEKGTDAIRLYLSETSPTED